MEDVRFSVRSRPRVEGAQQRYYRRAGVTGTEHIGREDTLDGDYGRLLENATMRKGVARPAGIEPAAPRLGERAE